MSLDSSASTSEEEFREGYLTKRGTLSGSWLRRYFILANGCLDCFETKNGRRLARIPLGGANVEFINGSFPYMNTFQLTCPSGETLHVHAETKEDMNFWVESLLRAAAAVSVMQGLLLMQVGFRKRWKQRYFVLGGRRLAWFESEANAKAPGGSVPIGFLSLAKSDVAGNLVRLTHKVQTGPQFTGFEEEMVKRSILIETGLVTADDPPPSSISDNVILIVAESEIEGMEWNTALGHAISGKGGYGNWSAMSDWQVSSSGVKYSAVSPASGSPFVDLAFDEDEIDIPSPRKSLSSSLETPSSLLDIVNKVDLAPVNSEMLDAPKTSLESNLNVHLSPSIDNEGSSLLRSLQPLSSTGSVSPSAVVISSATGAIGEAVFEKTLSVKEGRSKWDATSRSALTSTATKYDVYREIEQQKILQKGNSLYEGSGGGRRGERSWDDTVDDRPAVLTSGFVQEQKSAAERTTSEKDAKNSEKNKGVTRSQTLEQESISAFNAEILAKEEEVKRKHREAEIAKEELAIAIRIKQLAEAEAFAQAQAQAAREAELLAQAQAAQAAREAELLAQAQAAREAELLAQAQAAQAAREAELLAQAQAAQAAREAELLAHAQAAQAAREAELLAQAQAAQAAREAELLAQAQAAQAAREAELLAQAQAAQAAREAELLAQAQAAQAAREAELLAQAHAAQAAREAELLAQAQAAQAAREAELLAQAHAAQAAREAELLAQAQAAQAAREAEALAQVQEAEATDDDRSKMRTILLEYLLKRSSAHEDPSQASFLSSTLVPEIEETLFQKASSRERYLDMSSLKSRLKVIFADRVQLQQKEDEKTSLQVGSVESNNSSSSSSNSSGVPVPARTFPSTPAANIQDSPSIDAPNSRSLMSPALDEHVRIKPPPADLLFEKPRWGNAPHPLKSVLPIRHYPSSGEFGGVIVKLVLETRAEQPPNLPSLNKWQHRGCAQCNCEITTGSFGVKANYCFYTELLFCPSCFGGEDGKGHLRAIPWRIVQKLDNSRFAVSKPAADFLDEVWDMPLVSLSIVAPRTLAGNLQLQRIAALRSVLTSLRENIVRSAAVNETAVSSSTKVSNDLNADESFSISAIALTSPAANKALTKVMNILRKTLGVTLTFLGEENELLPISLVCICASQRGAGAIIRKLENAQVQLQSFLEGNKKGSSEEGKGISDSKSLGRNSRGDSGMFTRFGSKSSISSPKFHRGSRKSVNQSYDRGAYLDEFEESEEEDDNDDEDEKE
jgi:hypothetical protein